MTARMIAMLVAIAVGSVPLAGCAGDPAAAPGRDYRKDFKGRDANDERAFCQQNPGDDDCFGRRF